MIDRIRKGSNVTPLLYYLYGPGRSDEHKDPHLVAGWRDPITSLEPRTLPSGKRDFTRLTGLLNTPLAAAGRRAQDGTVWHCVLSAAPADRLLSDDEWNAIATEFMHQMGLARRDDPEGVRWVAVRHGLSRGGIDHIHIAATLARQDGGLPSVHNDFLRARHACRSIEKRFGLTVTAPADRTAAVRATRAEMERAVRIGADEPPRIALRRAVQEAAAVAASEADFFGRLRDAGVLIRERPSDRDPARITGFAAGLPSHLSRNGGQVWFSGGKLAPDLTLPRLRRRWERSGNTERPGSVSGAAMSPRTARVFLRSAAERAAERAADHEQFFAGLETQGVSVRLRYSSRDPGEVTGYSVTVRGHVDARGEPVWYSGGRLADGLTLPRLQARWASGTATVKAAGDPAERRAVWEDIVRLTGDSACQFRDLVTSSPAAASDVAAAAADALRVSARVVGGKAGTDLRRAAAEFDRAARDAYGAVPPPTPAGDQLRTAARLLAAASRPGRASTTLLVANLAELAAATAELRYYQQRAHQAAAALATVTHLHDGTTAHMDAATPLPRRDSRSRQVAARSTTSSRRTLSREQRPRGRDRTPLTDTGLYAHSTHTAHRSLPSKSQAYTMSQDAQGWRTTG